MHSSVCSSLSWEETHSWVSFSQSFMMFYYSKLWEGMFQTPLVPSTPRISGDCTQTWRESGTSGTAGFGIFKWLWQTRGLENKMQLWPVLSCVIRRCSCRNDLSLKFIHIHTGDQRTFWLVFAFYFISYCCNSRKHYRNLECRNKIVWLFNLCQSFRGTSFTRND